MIDIHCHILPAIDDGPEDLQTAVNMARIAANDGIRKIVATPHIKDLLHPKQHLERLVGELNGFLQNKKIPVEILLGGDVFGLLDSTRLHDYTIAGSRYILTEFPHHYMPGNSKEILFALALEGFVPIITHPERNGAVLKNPELLLELLHSNVLVQITAGSLTGEFGREEQACAVYLLQKRAVHFIATDAHSDQYRKPELSAGLKVAEKIIGKGDARKLVQDNPAAVLADKVMF